LLEHLRGDAAEQPAEERRPHECALVEARVDRGAERLEAVQADVLHLPLVAQCFERRRRLSLAGGRERAPLLVVPVERRLVRQIPAVLVENERAAVVQQRDNVVERVPEVSDVVQRVGGDDGVEQSLLRLQVVEPDPAEALALRRERVDPQHVVAGGRQRRRQLAVAAADVEHARRRSG